jgi:class 3 adenylate cyclase
MADSLTLTILFADIEGSAALYDAHGDEAANAFVMDVLDRVGAVVAARGGTVVKTMGDEVLATFAEPYAAVAAAIEMNRSLEDRPPRLDGAVRPIALSAGLHHGPVLGNGNDVFGDSVNLASRMVAMARGGQILATEEVVRPLPRVERESARLIDVRPVKGKAGDVRIYEIIWEPEALTMLVDLDGMRQTGDARLEVHYGESRFSLDSNRTALTLGRGHENDLVCPGGRTSRRHARIELRRGNFVLVDESTNGTWLAERGKETIRLRREEAPLFEGGWIGLGEPEDPDGPDVVRYERKS